MAPLDLFGLLSKTLDSLPCFYTLDDPNRAVEWKLVVSTSCTGSEKDEFPNQWLLSKFAGTDTVSSICNLKSNNNIVYSLFSDRKRILNDNQYLGIDVDYLALFEPVFESKVILKF